MTTLQLNNRDTFQPDVVLDHLGLNVANHVTSGTYGAGAIHYSEIGDHTGTVMGWPLAVAPGEYELWIEYAALESRPLTVWIGERQVIANAATESTGGWWMQHQVARYQGLVQIQPGETSLSLRAAGAIPHVKTVYLRASNGQSVPMMSIDEAAQAALSPRPHRDTAGHLYDVVRDLVPVVRSALNAGFSIADVGEIAEGLAAAIRQDQTNPQLRIGFSGPLNGQPVRQAAFLHLHEMINFDALIETGAYRGTTIEYFAGFGLPVFSCEVMKNNFYFSASRLTGLKNVNLFLEDSRAFLRRYYRDYAAQFNRPAFYLDAHWQDDLPLPEEIDIIAENQENFVIVVDDFKSPFDDGYGYDIYANGNQLTLEWVLPRLTTTRKLAYFFPALGVESEGGARRGTLFIVPEEYYEANLANTRMFLRAK